MYHKLTQYERKEARAVYINVSKVRGKMAERGLTISKMAELLEVNRNTYANYLEMPEKMPYRIIARMAEILCDSWEEATTIFFAIDLRSA